MMKSLFKTGLSLLVLAAAVNSGAVPDGFIPFETTLHDEATGRATVEDQTRTESTASNHETAGWPSPFIWSFTLLPAGVTPPLKIDDTINVTTIAPITENSTTNEPIKKNETSNELITDNETTNASITKVENTNEPIKDHETTNALITDDETTNAPITDKVTTNEPITEDVTTNEPTTDDATTNEPTTEDVTTNEPTTDDVTTNEPTTDNVTTNEPITEDVTTNEPITDDVTTIELTTFTEDETTTGPDGITGKDLTTSPGQTPTPNITAVGVDACPDDERGLKPTTYAIKCVNVREKDRTATVVVTRSQDNGVARLRYKITTANKGINPAVVPAEGNVFFLPGQLQTTITVPLVDDGIKEVDERHLVTIRQPIPNGIIKKGVANLVVLDDD